MNYTLLPYRCKIYYILLFGVFLLFISCNSEPILLNPNGGYQYYKKSFSLNSSNTYSVQNEEHTGYSSRLYAGMLINGAKINSLIKFLSSDFDSTDFCNADSIIDLKLRLYSTNPLTSNKSSNLDSTFLDTSLFNSYLIDSNEINNINESTILSKTDSIQIEDALSNLSLTIPFDINSNYIDLKLFDFDSTIFSNSCNGQDFSIIISYSSLDSSFLEFYSSDSENMDLAPKLFIEYGIKEEVSVKYNRYSLQDINWSSNFSNFSDKPVYFEKNLYDSLDIIHIYAFNLMESSIKPYPGISSYDSLIFKKDIIDNSQINNSIEIIDVSLKINEKLDLNDTIIFMISNPFAFIGAIDPSNDNYSENNLDNTENNYKYDLGEFFQDVGFDNCPDSLETGNGGCGDTLTIYNSVGSEKNNNLDWSDLNQNGVWDDQEGEKWWDYGIDGCEDKYELGNDSCSIFENTDWIIGLDPNKDNYIIDPNQDDWPDGNEGNGIWDAGESFRDWGSDGLPASVINGIYDINGTEGNGIWDLGEPFDDTGSDGLYSKEEIGYNIYGSENNGQCDGIAEFNDCGIDNCCDDDITCVDSEIDNYNIDPNNDNAFIDSSFTEGNMSLDWIDYNENGLWDKGEGEEWYDWGLDNIIDSLETFRDSLIIIPEVYNNYVFPLANNQIEIAAELVDSSISLWISNIERSDNILKLSINVKSNIELKGLQFSITHNPYSINDTIFQISEFGFGEINSKKVIEDLSILPRISYSEQDLENKLMIDYANNVTAYLDFIELDNFLSDGENIITQEYSNLILYIDSLNSNLYSDMLLTISHIDDSEQIQILQVKNITNVSDSVIIPIGRVLRAYQSGAINNYTKLILNSGSNYYNYSNLSFLKNSKIDLLYTK